MVNKEHVGCLSDCELNTNVLRYCRRTVARGEEPAAGAELKEANAASGTVCRLWFVGVRRCHMLVCGRGCVKELSEVIVRIVWSVDRRNPALSMLCTMYDGLLAHEAAERLAAQRVGIRRHLHLNVDRL